MDEYHENDGKWDDREEAGTSVHNKKNNVLPLWGNERSMNLNPLILTNIQSSHYFKVNLYELKTYHEVIDEIYYKVAHLEPWEKGSRKTAGQTGMCGGVRGVGAGGIVSTAFCLLYKLFTLKLTRKQVIGLVTHPDSPYIRGLGFMYIRYTQPPADLWDWYEPYLDDIEELDVKAGGGQVMMIGNILKNFLCKLEWFSTLFPRIPVPIQQKIERKMNEKYPSSAQPAAANRGDSRGENDSNNYSRDRCKTSRSYEAVPQDDRRSHSSYRSSSRDCFRDRSPYSKNGYQCSSGDRYSDRHSDRERNRYKEREGRWGDDGNHRSHKYSRERSLEDSYRKDARKYKDENDYRKEKKHKEEKRRSSTSEKYRFHDKSEKCSKYKDKDYVTHRRRGNKDRYSYEETDDIKRSK